MKIFGPYERKDGRMHVIIIDNNNRRTVSYPKYLMEQHIGKKLDFNETIHHIDGDFTNNKLSNLKIIDRKIHAAQDVIRIKKIKVECVWCGKKMIRKAIATHNNSEKGCAGPFCKPCAGLYGAMIQNNRIERLKPQKNVPVEEREYYKAGMMEKADIEDLKSSGVIPVWVRVPLSAPSKLFPRPNKLFPRPVKKYPR